MKREDVKIGETYVHNGRYVTAWKGKKLTVKGKGIYFHWSGEVEGIGLRAFDTDSLDPIKLEVNEGDLVSLTKGAYILQGDVIDGNYMSIEDDIRDLNILLNDGWDLKVIERAKPKLPTEPGYYVAYREYGTELYELGRNGGWYRDGKYVVVDGLKLTRLVPETQP